MDTFNYCPSRMVPETLPRETNASAVTMNGWDFVAKPTTPYKRKFKITLHGLRWYLAANDLYDTTTNVNFNARKLELFYQANEQWNPFTFPHPHLGNIVVRFADKVTVPAAEQNSGGFIKPLEIMLIEHNPSY